MQRKSFMELSSEAVNRIWPKLKVENPIILCYKDFRNSHWLKASDQPIGMLKNEHSINLR